MAVAAVAATGLAAGAVYLAYRRRRNADDRMLDELTEAAQMSAASSGEGFEPVQVNAPEPLTGRIADLAHGVDDPQ
jgi:hypothetical protein